MAPAVQLETLSLNDRLSITGPMRRPGARETQAARRHGHFGLKPAPAAGAAGTPIRRDFKPEKEGVI